jgi:hypothetical protein
VPFRINSGLKLVSHPSSDIAFLRARSKIRPFRIPDLLINTRRRNSRGPVPYLRLAAGGAGDLIKTKQPSSDAGKSRRGSSRRSCRQ